MGNRVYITVEALDNENKLQQKTFYMHWNGCMMTWAPLANQLFERGITSIDTVLDVLKKLELKYELQDSPDAYFYTEENGHHYIDLTKREFLSRGEHSSVRHVVTDLFDAFNKELRKYREDYREEKSKQWKELQDDVRTFLIEREGK